MNELALFAGAGGGILGGHLLGWRTVCAVENDTYAASVLVARQNDGLLPAFPIWDDVCTFDGTRWRGRVDVVSGGFPCQDISAAGKGADIEGARSGLWVEMARIVREVRPRFVFVENSPVLTSRGLGRVLGDLAAMGFDARWGVLGANHAAGFHGRGRMWVVADSNRDADGLQFNQRTRRSTPTRCNLTGKGRPLARVGVDSSRTPSREQKEGCWDGPSPRVGRVADGVAHRVDRLSAIGNGQVPAVAALAWETLSK